MITISTTPAQHTQVVYNRKHIMESPNIYNLGGHGSLYLKASQKISRLIESSKYVSDIDTFDHEEDFEPPVIRFKVTGKAKVKFVHAGKKYMPIHSES